jgi:arsenate reductase (glutaredoxin)
MKKGPSASVARSSKSRNAKTRTVAKTPGAVGAKSDSRKSVKFLHKPNCTTCRKARAYMEHRGIPLDFRDLGKERLSVTELEELIGPRDHTEFLNTRNELYREKNMKENPPSRSEALRMMAAEPNLIRRPIVVAGGRVVIGFDEKGMATL